MGTISSIGRASKEATRVAREAAKKASKLSSAAKKGHKTRNKNKKKATKADEKARAAVLAARKKKHVGKKPAQKRLPDKKVEVEGAILDPDTEGSVDVARAVGTRGERVDTGAGTRSQGFTKEQETAATRKRANNIIKLEAKRKAGTLTKREWGQLRRYNKEDAASAEAQAGRSIKSRQAKSEAQKRRRLSGRDDYAEMLETGVISEGMTPNQIETAVRNFEARKALNKPPTTQAVARALTEAASQPKMARKNPLGQARGHGGPAIFTPNPRRRRKNNKGGLVKADHKDYRKGGIFY
jgi:hypothetical protein